MSRIVPGQRGHSDESNDVCAKPVEPHDEHRPEAGRVDWHSPRSSIDRGSSVTRGGDNPLSQGLGAQHAGYAVHARVVQKADTCSSSTTQP